MIVKGVLSLTKIKDSLCHNQKHAKDDFCHLCPTPKVRIKANFSFHERECADTLNPTKNLG